MQHALDCMIGGYRNVMHNELRDTVANVLKKATIKLWKHEPRLPLSGEHFEYKSANCDEDARSDIKVNGFWRPMRMAFLILRS